MFTGATKIVKPEGQEADEFEQTVAQELFNLEVSPRSTALQVHGLLRCVVYCLYRVPRLLLCKNTSFRLL